MSTRYYAPSFTKSEQAFHYAHLAIKAPLNIEAVFSDESPAYLSISGVGKPAVIRLRAGFQNVDAAYVHVLRLTPAQAGSPQGEQKFPLQIEPASQIENSLFSYFTLTLPAVPASLNYYFSLEKNGRVYYYNKRGLYLDVDPAYHFRLYPGFQTPDWAKGAVMYQVYVDRFCNGDKTNDVVTNEYKYLGKAAQKIDDWNQSLYNDDVCNFYGGDLQGVMQKMSYLRFLGVDVIYFNPIFVSPSNHKYDTQDYNYVDPHYGVILKDGGAPMSFEQFNNRYATMYIARTTQKENLEASNQLMCDLIALAHQNGIRVILDGVFNHCGAFNKWLDKEGFYSGHGYPSGAYRDEKSPYHDYFRWYDQNWPNNDCYDSWWGYDNHPKLNYEGSKDLYDYILHIARKWVSPPFNADGWRLDVAADLGYSREFNHKFWRDFRKAVKEGNPEAIILAEHYGDPSEWLLGDQWDTVMNYDAFMEPITWFLTGMDKHSEEYREDLLNNAMAFEGAMRYHMARFSYQSLMVSMNELSNHDHSRFLTRTNRTAGRLHTLGAAAAEKGVNKAVMMEAVVFQMTWPGAPTIYYGDEAGLCGWTDPDNRRPYPWGREDIALLDLHREMIRLHKRFQVLRTGSLEYLYTYEGFLSYGRFDEHNRIAVAVNNTVNAVEERIPVWKIGMAPNGRVEELIRCADGTFTTELRQYSLEKGYLRLQVPPMSAIVLAELNA